MKVLRVSFVGVRSGSFGPCSTRWGFVYEVESARRSRPDDDLALDLHRDAERAARHTDGTAGNIYRVMSEVCK